MKKLHVFCPICGKNKFLHIPKSIFNIDEGYLLKLPIKTGDVCEHTFLCVIDYHFSIRAYETENVQKYCDLMDNHNKSQDLLFF